MKKRSSKYSVSTRAMGVLWALWSCALCLPVSAQAAPGQLENAAPRGPADVMRSVQRARAAAEKKPLDGASKTAQPTAAGAAQAPSGHTPTDAQPAAATALPPGHPAIGDQAGADPDETGAMPPGHPPVGDDDSGVPMVAGKALATAAVSSDLPSGTIRVHVRDEHDQPVANADVQVGTMSQDSGRTSLPGKTGADGTYTFQKLATGERLAYRANLLYDGVKTSCMPFRLPDDHGYDVVLRRTPTTHDVDKIVLYVGATSIELKDERIKLVQQARLLNIGTATYVFPEKGLLVPLPKDALAFQADAVMTDQHLVDAKGEGFTLSGSLPPGEVTLTWGFDVPRTGSEADLSFQIPWPTFAYRVIADAVPGMTLDIDDMPTPQLQADEGRRFLVSELVRQQGQPPMRSLHLHLRGIPGPGPMRYFAVALGMLVIGFGLVIAVRAPARTREQDAGQFAQRKQALLDRASALKAEQTQGEIGPEFYEQSLAQLEEELAALLYEQTKLARK